MREKDPSSPAFPRLAAEGANAGVADRYKRLVPFTSSPLHLFTSRPESLPLITGNETPLR
jgi:hypothetical protein